MADTTTTNETTGSNGAAKPKANGTARKRASSAASTAKRSAAQRTPAPKRRSTNAKKRNSRTAQYSQAIRQSVSDVPTWVTTLASVVGVGVAVGAGLFATRNQWLPRARGIADDFNAAFADDETDSDNFDQTRHAGRESMRDDPGEDWDDIDDIADASFPASDPPSFSPRPS